MPNPQPGGPGFDFGGVVLLDSWQSPEEPSKRHPAKRNSVILRMETTLPFGTSTNPDII